MPRFEIGWSYGGDTTVEANNEEEARRVFNETFNLVDNVRNASDIGVDIQTVRNVAKED